MNPQAGVSHGRVLLIRTMRAAPDLQSRALRTLAADGSVDSAAYDDWAVAPGDGVEQALRDHLAAGGQFAAVIAPGSRLAPDLVLESELLEFIGDPPHGKARITLSVVLTTPDGRRPQLQWRQTATAKLTSAEGQAVSQALNAALADILNQLDAALASHRIIQAG